MQPRHGSVQIRRSCVGYCGRQVLNPIGAWREGISSLELLRCLYKGQLLAAGRSPLFIAELGLAPVGSCFGAQLNNRALK